LSSPEAPTEDAPAPEPEPVDALRAGLLAAFETELGEGVVDSHIRAGDDLWVRIAADAWVAAGHFAHDKLDCKYFNFLSAIDWLPSPWGRYEDSDLDHPMGMPTDLTPSGQGYAGGTTRFQVFARVNSIRRNHAVTLKVDVPDDTLALASWTPVYAGADWHERETWEMYGIDFIGHPDLRHIYLPTEFEGHPLRKDFPLLARVVKPWPGIVDVEPMPGEDPAAAEEEEQS
jgi:NADH-quinone oxidoreductase subunit C